MRKFTDTHRLQALSDAELVGRWEETALRTAQRVRFGGKKLRQGTLLNALALHFVTLPEAERESLAMSAIRELEMFLAETDEERERADEAADEPEKPAPAPEKPQPRVGNPRRTTERDKKLDQEHRKGGKGGRKPKRSGGDNPDRKDKGADRDDLVPSRR